MSTASRTALKMLPSVTCVAQLSTDVGQAALMLQTRDGARYLVGRIGEGFQRCLAQSRVRSQRLSGVFLTGQTSWPSVSGLPGYLLSLGDVTWPGIIYTGTPAPVEAMVRSWRHFTFHNPLNFQVETAAPYMDQNLALHAVNVESTSGPVSVSYILQMMPTRGKFLVDKARQLGVPAGPLFSQLTQGFPVTTANGTVVEPSQVLEPTPDPARVLVLDLPSQEHLEGVDPEAFVRRLKHKRSQTSYEVVVRAVFYFLGPDVDLESDAFKRVKDAFKEADHFVSHPKYVQDRLLLTGFGEMSACLERYPESFRKLVVNSSAEKLPEGLTLIQQGLSVSLAPYQVENETGCDGPEVTEQGHLPECTEPEVITIGTGASCPGVFRNVSGTLVREPTGSILFDCGESTFNVLRRLFGDKTQTLLRELKAIYISHLHADHHLGLLSMISEWQRVNPGTLTLLAPSKIISFLREWKCNLERISFVDLETLLDGQVEVLPGMFVHTCKAVHTAKSYCVVVRYASGFRAAYSGDTRPCIDFIRIGQEVDLLIHEATLQDSMSKSAFDKRHSVMREALQVASDMNAKHLVLTHFSPRYALVPVLSPANKTTRPTCYGFDGMRAPLSHIATLGGDLNEMERLIEHLRSSNPEVENEDVEA